VVRDIVEDRVASKDRARNTVIKVEKDKVEDTVADTVADKEAEDDEGYVYKPKYSKCQPTGWHI
jgi:hypothetical protein